jgi:hypothetical protein
VLVDRAVGKLTAALHFGPKQRIDKGLLHCCMNRELVNYLLGRSTPRLRSQGTRSSPRKP